MRLMLLMLGMVSVAGSAFAADPMREMSLQMSRYEQMIGRLQSGIERLQSDVRTLQRENTVLQKAVDDARKQSASVEDRMQSLQNVDFGNLQAQQKALSDRLVGQKEVYDWGSGQRGCDELQVRHQQIKTTVSPDGLRAVKYLCFDGRVLHLGTQLNTIE